jgi:predicted Fe-S protein YdhL (DUF1289 family)
MSTVVIDLDLPLFAMTDSDTSHVPSPCISVCVLDPRTKVCIGCGRTIDEIASWGDLGDDERREVLARLPERLAHVGGKPKSEAER